MPNTIQNSDLISREALMDNIRACELLAYNGETYISVENLEEALEKTPYVSVAPIAHAYWHDVYLVSASVATGVCSHCGAKSHLSPFFPFALFCPNCGAKME